MTEEGRKRGCGHWLSLHCCCCEGLWPAPSMAAHRQQLGRHPLEQPWLPQMLSLVTFSWLDPLFRQGRRRRIDAADLLPVPRSDSAQTATDDIETQWQGMLARQRRPRAAFMRAAVWSSWRVFMAAGVALLAEAALLLLAPWLLSRLLAELAKPDATFDSSTAYGFAGGLAAVNILIGTMHHISFFLAQASAWRVRTATIGLLYRKAMRLSVQTLASVSGGHIVNLASNDAERYTLGVAFGHYIWISPLQLIGGIILMWQYVGPFALCGTGFLLLMMPLHGYTASLYAKYRTRTGGLTDTRVRIMSEVLRGMRVVKMYGWEKPFSSLVADVRRKEVKEIQKTNNLRAMNMALFFAMPVLAAFLTLAPYAADGNVFTAEKIFLVLGVMSALQTGMALFFPNSVHGISEMSASCYRIEKFLRQPERHVVSLSSKDNKSANQDLQTSTTPGSIKLDNVTCAWNEENVSLQNVSLDVKPGRTLGIIGPVGSGKSTLLYLLLGELEKSSGEIKIEGELSYASQEPWIINETVRENIIFGNEFDEARYNAVVKACSLEPDIASFTNGHETEIGERGVTLSGGQKARISLARAVYRKADIYLLDDPLSAVDTKVGRQIVDQCIRGLLKGATVLLVTHQVHHLISADEILALESGGHVLDYGDLKTLLEKHPNLLQEAGVQTVLTKPSERAAADKADAKVSELDQRQLLSPDSQAQEAEHSSLSTSIGPTGPLPEPPASSDEGTPLEEEKPPPTDNVAKHNLVQEESRVMGIVSWSTYRDYAKLCGSAVYMLIAVLLLIITQCAYLAAEVYLARWTEFEPPSQRTKGVYIGIYAALTFGLVFLAAVRAWWYVRGMTTASRRLHDSIFYHVMHAPVLFFDTNVVGRILNRFSADLGLIDQLLPYTFIDFIQLSGVIIGTVLLVSVINPWIFLLTVPLCVVLWIVRNYWLRVGREVKRLEAVQRSPLYAHITTSVAGAATIRSQNGVGRAVHFMHDRQDDHGAAYHCFLAISRWLGFRLDMLTFTLVIVVVFTAVPLRDVIEPSLVGLSLIYCLRLTASAQWCVRQSAEVEGLMTSVERALEYTKLEAEPDPPDAGQEEAGSENGVVSPSTSENGSSTRHDSTRTVSTSTVSTNGVLTEGKGAAQHQQTLAVAPRKKTKKTLRTLLSGSKLPAPIVVAEPPPNWPDMGTVVFHQVYMRYSKTLPPTLKNVSFFLQPGDKVGIVGRTGAGKSSLLAALFRMCPVSGNIVIDGIDTGTVPLARLRRSLSVIPQDPVLFTGSVRYNLDPFGEYDDGKLWQALEAVQLKVAVESLTGGLSAEVHESGSNFSVGQRQLFCLARALLRRNRILILDEATANVDNDTDRLIQRTLREEFKDCTVMTIAHRLHTIMDSTMIMVMDRGELVEKGAPYELLLDPETHFSGFVRHTTPKAFNALLSIAKSHHLSHSNPRRSSCV